MRLPPLVCVVTVVLASALLGTPAEAAPKKPGTVGLVSVTSTNSYASGAKKYARVAIQWPKAKRATRYEVFVARTKAKVAKKRKPTKVVRKPKAVIHELKRNRTYWFQVRALNGKRAGNRSARIARVTPVGRAKLSKRTHPVHSMMSYNVCSNACKTRKWTKRQPLVVNQILAVRPDVVALQEASRWSTTIPGYTEALGGHDNRILYRDDVYEQVTRDLTPPADPVEPPDPENPDEPTPEPTEPPEPWIEPIDGVTDPPGKNAPWVLLRHRATGQETVFVAVHLLTGDTNANARYRATQSRTIFSDLDAQLAWWDLDMRQIPIAFIGDYNTNRSRSNHQVVEAEMKRYGFWDTYEQARTLSRQHQNTANPYWQWRTPTIGVTWGDHVDKVWVRPGRSVVHSWANVGLMNGSQYLAPLPSDHHPLLVRAQLS